VLRLKETLHVFGELVPARPGNVADRFGAPRPRLVRLPHAVQNFRIGRAVAAEELVAKVGRQDKLGGLTGMGAVRRAFPLELIERDAAFREGRPVNR